METLLQDWTYSLTVITDVFLLVDNFTNTISPLAEYSCDHFAKLQLNYPSHSGPLLLVFYTRTLARSLT